jgi:chromosomal replication initiation ATPase DnaA
MIAQVIAHHAAALIGVHVAEIYGRSHRRRPALARHLVWFVLHERFAWDYSSIAREFNRERQPVMRAVEAVEDQIVLFPDVREIVRVMRQEPYLQLVQNYTCTCGKVATWQEDDQQSTTGKNSNPS